MTAALLQKLAIEGKITAHQYDRETIKTALQIQYAGLVSEGTYNEITQAWTWASN